MKSNINFFNQPIGQLGFVVENLEQSIENYYKQWDVCSWDICTYGPQNLNLMTYYGLPSSYTIRIALSYIGESRIELIQNIEGETVYTDHIKKYGYGLHHLGIYVQDRFKAISDIKEKGFSIIMEGGGQGLDGDGYFGYIDTEQTLGVVYEIIERPKRRAAPESRLLTL